MGAPVEQGSPPLPFRTQPRYHFMGKDFPWPSIPALYLPLTEVMLLSSGWLIILFYTFFFSLHFPPTYKSVSPKRYWIPWRRRLWYIYAFLNLGCRRGSKVGRKRTNEHNWALWNTDLGMMSLQVTMQKKLQFMCRTLLQGKSQCLGWSSSSCQGTTGRCLGGIEWLTAQLLNRITKGPTLLNEAWWEPSGASQVRSQRRFLCDCLPHTWGERTLKVTAIH